MSNFIQLDDRTYLVPMPRSAITGRFLKRDDRAPSDKPVDEEMIPRDYHPEAQPVDEGNAHTFSDDESDAIQIYIDDIKMALGLEGWDVFVGIAKAQPDANASIHPVYGRRVAALLVNEEWFSYRPIDQRNTIVHELLHLVHNSQTESIRTLPVSAVNSVVWTTVMRETELMVDHLAGVIAEYMPMPHLVKDVANWRANKTGPFEE